MYKLSKVTFIFLALFSASFVLNSCNNSSKASKTINTLESEINKMEEQKKLLRHVVLFNFNDNATDEIVKNIEQEFANLPEKISEIYSFEWGVNNSPEKLNKEFTHCFLVTFLTEEDRDNYLPHPSHQSFVKLIGSYIEDVTVIDYWAL